MMKSDTEVSVTNPVAAATMPVAMPVAIPVAVPLAVGGGLPPLPELAPESSPSPWFEERTVEGMAMTCETCISRHLQPGEFIVKHVAGYLPGRLRIRLIHCLLVLPAIFLALRFIVGAICCRCCLNRKIVHERVFLAVTNRRRIIFWTNRQTGFIPSSCRCACDCCSDTTAVRTETDIAVFQLDKLTGLELGYERRALPIFSCIPGCGTMWTAELCLSFGGRTERLLTLNGRYLLSTKQTGASGIRKLWDDQFKLAFASDSTSGLLRPVKNVIGYGVSTLLSALTFLLESTETIQRALERLLLIVAASFMGSGIDGLSDTYLKHLSTGVRIQFTQDFVQSNGQSVFAKLLEFEEALMAMNPRHMICTAVTRNDAHTAHFCLNAVDKPLVEAVPFSGIGAPGEKTTGQVYRVNMNPKLIRFMPGEHVLDAHAAHIRWSLYDVLMTAFTLGCYYFTTVRRKLLTQNAVVVTTNRVIEMHANAELDPDSLNLVFIKRWFTVDRGCITMLAATHNNYVKADLVLKDMSCLQLELFAAQPWWSWSPMSLQKRCRLFGFLSRFQQHIPVRSVQVDSRLIIDPNHFNQHMTPEWQATGVTLLPGEHVVALAPGKTNAFCFGLQRLISLGFSPFVVQNMVVLTNMRLIGFATTSNEPLFCPFWQRIVTVTYWAPIFLLSATAVHGVHDYSYTPKNCLYNCCCPAGYTSVSTKVGIQDSYPVHFYQSEWVMASIGGKPSPGIMENEQLLTFFDRSCHLAEAVQQQQQDDMVDVHVDA